MASGAYTHTHTHTHTHTLADESDYKKPGAPAAGRRAWFNNIIQLNFGYRKLQDGYVSLKCKKCLNSDKAT